MIINLFNSRINIFLISLLAAIFITAILQYTWIAAAIILLAFLTYYFGKDFLLAILILAYLVVTGDGAESLRNILNIAALVCLILMFFYRHGFEIKNYPRVPKEIISFVLFLFFTLFMSSIFSKEPVNGAVSIIRMAVFLLICYIFYSLIENRKAIYIYMTGLFLAVMVLGGSILISLARSGFSFIDLAGTLARFAGFYENPNYAGLLLVVSVPILVSLYFQEYFKSKWKKLLITFFLLICIAILMLTDSRASLLAIAVSLAFIIAVLNRPLFIKIFISLLITCGILLLIPDVQNFLELYLRLDRLSNRDYFWNTGIDIIKAYPVFGVGPDMFQNYFFTYMPSAVNKFYNAGVWVVGKPHPHNFFIFFTAENGILGLISAVYFWVLFFYTGVKTIISTKKISKEYFILIVSITGIGLGMFVRSFFEITGYLTYGFITRDLPFWLMFVILIKVYYKINKDKVESFA
jgi:O-antigen ligase